MENKYTVSVLFVKYEDFWSKVVYYILGRGYSHAAIGVDEEEEVYYSFNFKGFRREKPRKNKHYFCSESVVEMLERARVASFEKSAAHYIPNRLEREVQQFRNLEQIIFNPIQRSYY